MGFEARHLRVQLPCGQVTIIGPSHTMNCMFDTCNWGSCRWSTCAFGSCTAASPCHFVTVACFTGTVCPMGTQVGCGPGTCGGSGDPGPDRVIISAEDLPALRAHLEAQLKELEEAERKLQERMKHDE